jgi:hypothetical protein
MVPSNFSSFVFEQKAVSRFFHAFSIKLYFHNNLLPLSKNTYYSSKQFLHVFTKLKKKIKLSEYQMSKW